MKKMLTLAAILCTAIIAPPQTSAQTSVQTSVQTAPRVPDEDDILAKTLSADSPFFYEPMMARYLAGDETLTDEHYFYLYYGFAYDPRYDPRAKMPGEDAIALIFARISDKAYTGQPTKEDASAIIEAAKQNMTVDPFSLPNINLMTYAYELAGDLEGARVSADRFQKIVRTITSSGSGQREKSPWHILRYSHADAVIEARGLKVVNRQVRSRTVEYLQVERNQQGMRGYFVDFGRIYSIN